MADEETDFVPLTACPSIVFFTLKPMGCGMDKINAMDNYFVSAFDLLSDFIQKNTKQ